MSSFVSVSVSNKNNPIQSLIYALDDLKYGENENFMTSSIQDYALLIESLNQLDKMVEMDSLKESVVKQIKYLIVNQNPKDNHMLHTVLYGPPGVGKTCVANILVNIWTSLGLLSPSVSVSVSDNQDKQTPEKENQEEKEKKKLIENLKTDIIYRLQTNISNLKFSVQSTLTEFEQIKDNLRKVKLSLPEYDKTLSEKITNKYRNTHRQRLGSALKNLILIEKKLNAETNYITPDEEVKFVNVEVIDLEQKNESDEPTQKNLETSSQKMKVVSREDFVGGYLGMTAIKTEELLKSSLGKVLFIDEAYSLINGERDSYGKEALTVLNRFMSEHPNEIIIIFAGYKKLMEETIFLYQPGLKSRCTWMFEIDGYSESGLAKIFVKQLSEEGWNIDETIDLNKFFRINQKEFPAFGRDTHRLCFYSKLCYAEHIFDTSSENNIKTKTITKTILNKALEHIKENRIKDNSDKFLSTMFL